MNLNPSRIWKLIVGPFLIPVAIAAGTEAFLAIYNLLPSEALRWAGIGLLAYLVIFPLLWWIPALNLGFMETLEHETIHSVMATLFFRRLSSLGVNPPDDNENLRGREGETVPVRGQRLNFWIYLSPYFFPVTTFLPLILHPFSQGTGRIVVDFLIGFTFGFHLVGVFREFGSYQDDIQQTTYFFAWSLIIIMNALVLIVIVSVLTQDFALIRDFAMATFDRTMDLYETGWRYAQQVLDGVTVTG